MFINADKEVNIHQPRGSMILTNKYFFCFQMITDANTERNINGSVPRSTIDAIVYICIYTKHKAAPHT